MVQNSILYIARNNQPIELRTPTADEAQTTLDAMAEISEFSPYILSTPESFKQRTTESQMKWIQDSISSQTSIIIAAYFNGKIIGFCNGQSYKDIKRSHRAGLGVSIHPKYRGLGLGRKMMEVLTENMKKFSGIKIIELDVMVNNMTALKLYESLGFKKAGSFPKAFILPSGEISDNLTMYIDV